MGVPNRFLADEESAEAIVRKNEMIAMRRIEYRLGRWQACIWRRRKNGVDVGTRRRDFRISWKKPLGWQSWTGSRHREVFGIRIGRDTIQSPNPKLFFRPPAHVLCSKRSG
jgi:hypothetical protein